MSVISTFSKGCKGSVALNACPGSGEFCASSCEFNVHGYVWKPGMPRCYTDGPQKRYKNLNKKLQRHADDFTEFLYGILSEMRYISCSPWLRFSSFGSFPGPSRITPHQLDLLKKIQKKIQPMIEKNRVHFPVETEIKYNFYKSLGFPVRLSLTSPESKISKGKRQSIVVGSLRDKMPVRRNLARAYAKKLRSQGIKAGLCPAVGAPSKCGSCKACATPLEVVVYPVHV